MNFKAYIHDKLTVFMNLVVLLLGIFNTLLVVLRVDTTQSVAIIRNNTTLGLAGFEKASSTSLYQFLLIALIITIGNTFISIRVHQIKRAVSLLVMGLTIVALIFLIVVSTAILGLHR